MDTLTILLIAVLLLGQLADVITTRRILAAGGRELNPVIRWAMEHLGQWGWVILKLAIAAAAISVAAQFQGLEPMLVLVPAALVSVVPPLLNLRHL